MSLFWKSCMDTSAWDDDDNNSEVGDASMLLCEGLINSSVYNNQSGKAVEASKTSGFDCVNFEPDGSILQPAQREKWKKILSDLFESYSGHDNSNATSSARTITKLKRISQEENWDCGVACLQMLLQWIRRKKLTLPQLQQERLFLLKELGTESIWTVDLVYVFDRMLSSSSFERHQNTPYDEGPLHAKYCFCSKSLQADESYGNYAYYEHTFEQDNTRIGRIFTMLRDGGSPVIQVNRLPLQQLQWMVDQPDAAAMVLVDNALLRYTCKSCSTSPRPKNQQQEIPSKTYAGHYILLVGTSNAPEHLERANIDKHRAFQEQGSIDASFCFVAFNPGQHPCTDVDGRMYIAPKLLEESWRAQGTDEDIVFVVLDPKGMIDSQKEEKSTKGMMRSSSNTDDPHCEARHATTSVHILN